MAKKIRSEFVKGWGKESGKGGGKKLDTNLDPLHTETDPLTIDPLSVETDPQIGDASIAESDPTAVEPLSVTTDKLDYAPGETALFTVTGVTEGGAVTFDLADDPADPGDDGDADIYPSFTIVDGGEGDLDGLADGSITAAWFVPTNGDPNNATLNLVVTDWGVDGALGGGDDRTATATFTDAAISYEQWETITGDWAGGQANSNQTGFVEGDVTPHRVLLTDLEPDTTYGIVVRFDYYQSNTNAGGRLYLDDYNATIDGDGDPDFPLPGTLSPDGVYTFSANDPAGGSYVSPELTFYIGDPDSDGEIIDIENLSYRIIEDPPTGSTFREAEIIFTTDDDYIGTTDADLYFGLRLAQPGEAYEPVNEQEVDGASGFAGGGLQTRIQGSGSDAGAINQDPTIDWISPSGNTAIQPGVIQPANPLISLDKTGMLNLGGDGIATPGDVITYTLTVENTGSTTLTNVALTDTGLDSIGPLSDTGMDGADVLAPGAIETATGTYAITQADIDAGVYDNLARVDSTAPDGSLVDDTDPHSEPIPQQDPLISLDKTGMLDLGGDGIATPGDIITYTLTVENETNTTLTNVALTDTGLDSIGPLSDTGMDGADVLAPGAIETATGTYAITQADIDAGVYDNLARVDSTAPDGSLVDDTDPHSEPIPQQDPLISLDKTGMLDLGGDGIATPGDIITYTLTVENETNTTLTNVALTDTGLDSIGPLSDTGMDGADVLAPGAIETATGTYAITQADIDAGVYDNLARVDSTAPDGSLVDDTDPHSEPIPQQDPLISLDKTGMLDLGGDGIATPGDIITYTLTVENETNTTLTNVALTDTGLDSIGPLSDTGMDGADVLAPGAIETATGTYAITQADIDAGVYDNLARVDSTAPDGSLVDDTDPHSEPIPQQDPLISLDKTGMLDLGGDGIATPGDIITYTLTVENETNTTLTNVALTDTGLDSIGPLSDTGMDGADVLAPGAIETATGTYAITQADIDAGVYDNLARVDSTAPDGSLVDDTDPHSEPIPQQDPLISLDKTGMLDLGGDGIATPGDIITYTLTVENETNTTLTNVALTDTGLDSIGPLSDTGMDGADVLAPGAIETATGTYAITQADIDAGVYDNLARVDSTAPDGSLVDDTDPHSEPIPQQDPLISLDKTGMLDLGGDGIATPGDIITYTLTVENETNTTLTNVALTDTGLDSIGPLSDTGMDGADVLAPGAIETATGTYAITQADIDAGVYDNLARVDSTAPDGSLVDDTDPHSEPIPQQDPLISLDKTGMLDLGGDGIATPGDIITYTLTVENETNTTLTNVALTDTGLDSIGPLSDTGMDGADVLAPGAIETATGTYAITQADIDAGVYDNLARVDSTAPDGSLVDDTDPHSEPIPQQDPLISLDKTGMLDLGGDGIATPGDIITYTLTVENETNTTLTNVALTDTGLDSIGPLSDTGMDGADVLAPGAIETATGTYAITQADIDAGVYDNLARVDSTAPDGSLVDDTDPHSEPIPQQDPLISLDKTGMLDLGGDGIATPGDIITYTLTVENETNTTLTNVALTDTGLDSIGPLSDTGMDGADVLAPGAIETATGTYAITQADIDAGVYDNLARVDSTAPDGSLVDDTDPHSEPIPQQDPLISLDKTGMLDLGGDGIATPGDIITYTLTVENETNTTLTNVALTDTGLDSIGPLSDTGMDGADVLAPGAIETATGTYAITQADIDAGVYDNLARVDSTAPDGSLVDDTDPHSEPIPQDPAIDILKTFSDNADEDMSGTVTVGDTLTYDLKVTNTGDVTLNDVTVTDPLTGTNQNLGTLAPDAMQTIQAMYVVQQSDIDDPDGEINNTASVTGDPPNEGDAVTDMDSEAVPVAQDPAIDILKTFSDNADEDMSGTVTVGDTLTYDLKVTNTGDVTLNDVTVMDPLTGTNQNLGTLAPDAMQTIQAMYVVQQSDIDDPDGEINNTASVTGDPANEGDAVTDMDSEAVPVAQDPAIEFDKVITDVAGGGPGGFVSQVGDVITYNFVVENTGDVDLTNVVVTDYFENEGPVQVTNRISGGNGDDVLDVGESWTFQLQRTVTQSDLDGARQIHTELQKVGWLWCATQECKGDLDLDNYALVSAQAGEEVLNDADYAAVNVTCPSGCIDGNGSSNGGSSAEGLWQAWLDAQAQEALA